MSIHNSDVQAAAVWFAGLSDWIAFSVRGKKCCTTADRAPDADGNVAIRFPDGVRRVPVAEVRMWTLWSDEPRVQVPRRGRRFT